MHIFAEMWILDWHRIFKYILLISVSISKIMADSDCSDFSITEAEGIYLTKTQFASGELIFEDTFQTLDLNVWLREPTNQAHVNEFQLFTDSNDNSYVQDGNLHITPTFWNDTAETENMVLYMKGKKYLRDTFHPIRSARLSTKESFSFTYGVVEFRAKVPLGDWLFPALWLMPKDSKYGSWPLSGEIDVMESRGNRNLTDSSGNIVGVQSVSNTLHWGPSKALDTWRLTYFTEENLSYYSSDFHTYKLIWAPESLSFYVDDKETGRISPPEGGFWELGNFSDDDVSNPWVDGTNSAPFDAQFYLIMNLAVGGTSFFSDSFTNEGGKPWSNSSPNATIEFWEGRNQWMPTWNLPSDGSHFLIDYVRVWAL
ncbi:hypothetical protein D910_04835 [Dendroctonus ponderosae]